MDIFTIGYGQKSAETFFELLKENRIKALIDIRLNNTSQLAGFTKKDDLSYFLKKICRIAYRHVLDLAPTKEIFDEYKKKGGSWASLEKEYLALISERKVENILKEKDFETPTVFLCSEPEPNRCHRRLLAEYLQSKWKSVTIRHL